MYGGIRVTFQQSHIPKASQENRSCGDVKDTFETITSPKDIVSASKFLDRLVDEDEDDEIKVEAFNARLDSREIDKERV